MSQFIVSPGLVGQRLDRALAKLTAATRSHIKMLIEHECVHVAGVVQKAGYALRLGDVIEIAPLVEPLAAAVPQKIALEILYEDDFLAAINKPAGMVVHPAPGQWQGTVVNALLAYWGWQESPASLRPGIVHRLDKDTSGVLLVAKDHQTQERLAAQFKERRIHKEYVAVVVGRFSALQGEIALPIGRHPSDRKKMSVHARHSRAAVSRYQVISQAQAMSLLRLFPETGRTHQLRVHLAAIGHPIVGDAVYGTRAMLRDLPPEGREFPRQALHAAAIEFCHPATQHPLAIVAPYPADLARLIETLQFDKEERKEKGELPSFVIDRKKKIQYSKTKSQIT